MNDERMASLAMAIGAAARAVSLEELGDEAFPRLAKALDATAGAIIFMEERDEEMQAHALGGQLRDGVPHYMRNIVADDPLFHASASDARPIHAPLRHAGLHTFRRSRAYCDFWRLHAFEDLLCMRFAGSQLIAGGAASMGFLRLGSQAQFSRDELKLAGLALPAFEGAARRIARAHTDRGRAAVEAIASTSAVLALDRMGTLLWTSAAARELLGPLLTRLPDSLVVAARRLARVAIAGTFDDLDPASSVVTIDRGDGTVLEGELSITYAANGESIIAVGLVDASSPRTLAARTAARFDLTPAEADVVALVARGRSNEAIAHHLHVSVATVKTHMVRVLRKLGVASRVQAALLVRKLG